MFKITHSKKKQINPIRKITISIYQIDKDQNVW